MRINLYVILEYIKSINENKRLNLKSNFKP